MGHAWILLFLGSVAVDFVVAPEGAYTAMECDGICNKRHGFVIAGPEKRLRITQAQVSEDGKTCGCPFYLKELPQFLENRDLDDNLFYTLYKKEPCLGRIWLKANGIQVEVPGIGKSKLSNTQGSSPDKTGERCDVQGAAELRKELAAGSKGAKDLVPQGVSSG